MPYRTTVNIEDHTTIFIKGFVNWYTGLGKAHKPMTIMGNVDGKRFSVRTSGNNTLGEIVKLILEATK